MKKKRGRPEKSKSLEREVRARISLDDDNMLSYICGIRKMTRSEVIRKLIYDEFQRLIKE